MTGKTGHRNNTTIGQRVSRHSLPTLLCFIFLPTPQNILKYEVFTNTIENKSAVSKFIANPQMAHLVLPDTQANPSQNQKSHFLQTHKQQLWKH